MQINLEELRPVPEEPQLGQFKTFISPEHYAKVKAAAKHVGVPMYMVIAKLIDECLPDVQNG